MNGWNSILLTYTSAPGLYGKLKKMPDEKLTIGRVAEVTGCTVETIRFYEKTKLVPKPIRSDGGHRIFSDDSVRRILFIKQSRELGFSMVAVKEILALADQSFTCREVRKRVDAHLDEIVDKMGRLESMRDSFLDIQRQCRRESEAKCLTFKSWPF